MTKLRYSAATADRLCRLMGELGSAKATFTAVQISAATYYGWLQQYPDLRLRLEVAKRKYHQFQDDENISMAKEWLKKLLVEGDRTVKVTTKEIVAQGQIVKVKETVQTQRPCPNWVIDRILGTGDELDAVQTLVSSGFIPDGVSAQVMEAIDRAGDEIREAFEYGELSHEDE